MIEIDGVVYRTKAQWEKMHRHTVGKGIERTWRSPKCNETYTFWSEEKTKPFSKKEMAKIARERAKKREALKLKESFDEGKECGYALAASDFAEKLFPRGYLNYVEMDAPCLFEFLMRPHTAYQWVSKGFVPLPTAQWRLCGPAEDYYYCFYYEVVFDYKRAHKLMESAPKEYDKLPDGRPYNGKPWWDE